MDLEMAMSKLVLVVSRGHMSTLGRSNTLATDYHGGMTPS
jgi:hypothetical protein